MDRQQTERLAVTAKDLLVTQPLEAKIHASEDHTLRLWDVSPENWLRIICEQLQYHPVLATPTTALARAAKQIYERYGYTGRAHPG